MTVKERLRQLVEELPDEMEDAAITAAENALRPYRNALLRGDGARVESLEERRARVKAARGSAPRRPGAVDEYYRRKHEDLKREEDQAARRAEGLG